MHACELLSLSSEPIYEVKNSCFLVDWSCRQEESLRDCHELNNELCDSLVFNHGMCVVHGKGLSGSLLLVQCNILCCGVLGFARPYVLSDHTRVILRVLDIYWQEPKTGVTGDLAPPPPPPQIWHPHAKFPRECGTPMQKLLGNLAPPMPKFLGSLEPH